MGEKDAKQLQAKGCVMACVGNGVNNGPAVAAAHEGISFQELARCVMNTHRSR